MKTKNGKGSGEAFTEQQKSTDDAINQRIKKGEGYEQAGPGRRKQSCKPKPPI